MFCHIVKKYPIFKISFICCCQLGAGSQTLKYEYKEDICKFLRKNINFTGLRDCLIIQMLPRAHSVKFADFFFIERLEIYLIDSMCPISKLEKSGRCMAGCDATAELCMYIRHCRRTIIFIKTWTKSLSILIMYTTHFWRYISWRQIHYCLFCKCFYWQFTMMSSLI